LKTFQKPLTAAEEAVYLKLLNGESAIQAAQAKETLIERNLRLVAHVVKKYQNVDEDMEDLISIGCIGLIKAIDTFDSNKGRLATYACRCIDNEILMMLRSKKKSSREVSLYEPIGQDKEGNEIRLLDILEQEQKDIIEEMELQTIKQKLLESIEVCLNEREKQIVIFRYGLKGMRVMTQNEIGQLLDISRSYVSRIEKKALEKLAKNLREASI